MSAHLAKNKIFTQLEDDGYISSKVIEKGSEDDEGFERLEENMLKQQPEDTLPCLNITTKMNHMVSSAIGDGIACMEGSHVKQNDTEIGKTPQDNACFHQVQVQDSTRGKKMECITFVDAHTIRHEEDVESCNAINIILHETMLDEVPETKDRSVAKRLHSVKKTYQLHHKPRRNYKGDNTDKEKDNNEEKDNKSNNNNPHPQSP